MNGMSESGIPIVIDGRRYRFDPDKYFATEPLGSAAPLIAPDDEHLQRLVHALLDESSGAEGET